jgi:hypothetical protein
MRGEIDPHIPFIQVDRSVAPLAAKLAPVLKVTYQHARGGLDVFWENLADRRLLSDGAGGVKAEIALPAKELETRLLLAFGVPVDLDLAVVVGIIDRRSDGLFRVRGMSRYLNMEAGRLSKKGGKRQGSNPEPERGDTPVSPGSDPSDMQDDTPIVPVSHPGEERGKRVEGRDPSSSEEEKRGELQFDLSPPVPLSDFAAMHPQQQLLVAESWTHQDFWKHVECVRRSFRWPAERWPNANKLKSWWSLARSGGRMVGDLLLTWVAFARTPHWQKADPKAPFGAFMTEWHKYTPAEASVLRPDVEAFLTALKRLEGHVDDVSAVERVRWTVEGDRLLGESTDDWAVTWWHDQALPPMVELRRAS